MFWEIRCGNCQVKKKYCEVSWSFRLGCFDCEVRDLDSE